MLEPIEFRSGIWGRVVAGMHAFKDINAVASEIEGTLLFSGDDPVLNGAFHLLRVGIGCMLESTTMDHLLGTFGIEQAQYSATSEAVSITSVGRDVSHAVMKA